MEVAADGPEVNGSISFVIRRSSHLEKLGSWSEDLGCNGRKQHLKNNYFYNY